MTETKQNSLGTEPIGRLLLKFSVPTALTLMVNCLYNIVDQIFIGHAVGIKGVAATNVTFPIGIIAAALALLIGDGCAANVSLHLGRGEQEEADRTFANAVMLLFGVGILLSVFGCIFARQLVVFFGASPSVVAEAVLYEHHSSGTALRHVQYGIYGNYPRGWQSAVYDAQYDDRCGIKCCA